MRDDIQFADIDFSAPDILDRVPNKQRRCTIIATMADSQITSVDLQKMMEAGMNVARFKMSSNTRGDRIKLLGKVDKAAEACCRKYGVVNWPIGTCIELKTCIIKTGILEEEVPYVDIIENSEVILSCNISDYNKCNASKIFVDNNHLTIDVQVGREILIGGNEIVLKCTEVIEEKKSVKCLVVKGGKLANVCNVCIRGIKQSRPYITKRDLQLVHFALEYQIDIITINYVRHVDAIKKTKQYIGKKIRRPIILSGICTEEGLDAIDDIIKVSDGIILAREYLPYEIEAGKKYRLANIQKWISAKCQQAGKPFFISGGEGFRHGKFSDSEVADIANAVLDGVSGFILKECDDIDITLDAIRLIHEICCAIEPYTSTKTQFWSLTDQVRMPINAAEAAIMSCAVLANQAKARIIILPTVTGRTAKALLWMRPSCLILAVCTNIRVTRMLHLYRCMVPLLYSGAPRKKWHQTVESRVHYAMEYAVKRGWLIYGDTYVTLQRATESSSFCDMVRIWSVTISKKSLVECNTLQEDND